MKPNPANAPEAVEGQKWDLDKVQEYLRQRLAGLKPDGLLTHEFDNFFRTYNQIIGNLARRSCAPRSSFDDVVQEVWFLISERLPQFHWRKRGQGALRSWVWKLVRNKAADVLRRQSRHPAQRLSAVVGTAREPQADQDWSARALA